MTDTRLIDIRTVERNIKAGKVSKEEYAEYLENLEDCADLAEESETQMVLHGVEVVEEAAEAEA